MRQVSLEDAYTEACKALGEAIVTQRLLSTELARISDENHAQPSSLSDEVPQ